MAAAEQVDSADCFHCGLSIPPGKLILGEVDGMAHPMCCVGCAAAAEMLDAAGLSAWYDYREGPSGRAAALPEVMLKEVAFLDSDALESEFVDVALTGDGDGDAEGRVAVSLLVEELRCAACVWVIEQHLGRMGGVHNVRVNLATHRARVEWDPAECRLRDLVERLAEIGFAARPDRPGAEDDRQLRENRSALIRLGIAGLGAMNVMTYSVALYVGAFDGMSQGSIALMRWLGWLVSTPVIVVSARPFFVGAWRDLSVGRPGMDVPVALAIGGAYVVSAVATFTGGGEVYFDSVCMFTFFLSLGRYLELRVRHKSSSFVRSLIEGAPAMARRIDCGEGIEGSREQVIPARLLAEGDHLRVLAGEVIPADGIVLTGESAVDEALLTGEPWPREVSPGDTVVAGSQNVDQILTLTAQRVGPRTALAAIVALIERAAADRAPIALLADRISVYFVVSVLGVALANFVMWSWIAPDRAVWTTLSVLVATCPCALSLATPAAIGAASQGLARAGFLITNSRAIETLARVDRFLFDKTGTLTQGIPRIAKVFVREGVTEAEALMVAARLERDSTHPIARAFRDALSSGSEGRIRDVNAESVEVLSAPGKGIEGWVDGRWFRIGRPDWKGDSLGHPPKGFSSVSMDHALVWISLVDEQGTLASFGLDDSLRQGASEAISALRAQGIEIEMLSGDPSPIAADLAKSLGMHVDQTGLTPNEKIERVLFLQKQGEKVAVVGDGVNDGPALRAGDLSIAMGTGSDLTRLNADAVLLRDDLELLPVARDWALRTRRVISQNLFWAAGYNLLALPLAVSGNLTPWMAALGMSASSLVVTLNALRLRHAKGVQ